MGRVLAQWPDGEGKEKANYIISYNDASCTRKLKGKNETREKDHYAISYLNIYFYFYFLGDAIGDGGARSLRYVLGSWKSLCHWNLPLSVFRSCAVSHMPISEGVPTNSGKESWPATRPLGCSGALVLIGAGIVGFGAPPKEGNNPLIVFVILPPLWPSGGGLLAIIERTMTVLRV